MNYQKHYDALILRAQIQNRKKYKATDSRYIPYEKHHIVPDCFYISRKRNGRAGHLDGNPDAKENLVLLTPEEHYLAHQLLVKIYPNHHGLVRAATMMCVSRNGLRSNNKLYGWLKKKDAIAKSEMQTGIKKGPNLKMRGRQSPRKGIPTGRKTKGTTGMTPWNKGAKMSVDSPKKGIPSGKKGVPSEKKGKTIGPREKLICPHCKKEGGTPMIILYHFDNCKDNPSNNGECTYISKERILAELTCPHCSKVGKGNSMKQWHFDRCKFKSPGFS